MRQLAIWRLAAILLLAAFPLATAAHPDFAPATLADNGKQGEGNGDKDTGASDDGNRGHGNDPDGHDEDNPGNSSGPGNDKDKKDDTGKAVETVPTAGYTVAVDCHPADDGLTTTCTFAATAPEGGKDVGFLQVPVDAVCAEVVESDARIVDPDPHTHVTGYTSRGKEGALTLALDGQVTTAGTATYWIKAGGEVFPIEGPGLRCDLAADAAADTPATATLPADVAPTATPAPSTGTVAVAMLTCTGVPADTEEFDWFGECSPSVDSPRDITLAPSDDSAPPDTAATDADGEATFTDVAPGDYRLELVEGSWCHAVSDHVTADSEVVVEAGTTSTVWIFICDGQAGM